MKTRILLQQNYFQSLLLFLPGLFILSFSNPQAEPVANRFTIYDRIEVDEPYGFQGQPLYLRCTLHLFKPRDPEYLGKTFTMEVETHKKCSLPKIDWTDCRLPPTSPLDENCGCTNNWRNLGHQYRFYYYVDKLNRAKQDGKSFKCSIGSLSERKLITVQHAKFVDGASSSQPIYACQDDTVQFKFQFVPRVSSPEFPLRTITLSRTSQRGQVAVFTVGNNAQIDQIINTAYRNRVRFEWKGKIITINVTNVKPEHKGEYSIRFDYDSPPHFVTVPKIPLITPITLNNTNTTTSCVVNGTAVGNPGNNTTGPCQKRRRKRHRQQQQQQQPQQQQLRQRRAPAEYEFFPIAAVTELPPTNLYLEYSRKVLITEPPSPRGAHVNLNYLRGQPSSDGRPTVIFTCRVQGMLSDGTPPINITIFHGNEQLITRTGTEVVRFRLVAPTLGKTSMCKFEGASLACLRSGDGRLRKSTLQVTNETETSDEGLSFDIILYSLAIIFIISMFCCALWTVTRHVRLMAKRKKKLELYRAKVILRHMADEMNECR